MRPRKFVARSARSQTRCPGVRISEHLPRMAARMDRLAIVRSMHHDSAPIHETGYQLLQTGRLGRAGDEQLPHIGSVVARLKGTTTGSAVIHGGSRPDRQHGCRHSSRRGGRMAWPDVRPVLSGGRPPGLDPSTLAAEKRRVQRRIRTHGVWPRAVCWRGSSSNPGYAWSRSICSIRSSTESPGIATGRRL